MAKQNEEGDDFLENLLVLGSYGKVTGGVETVMHSVVPRLGKDFEILVIAPRRRRRFHRDFRDANITVKYQACGTIPRLTVSQPFVKLARIWRRILKEVPSFKPDVVWANDESLLMAARLAGFDKIVTTMHGLTREAIAAEREVMNACEWAISTFLLDRFTREALKQASVITTYSNYLQKRIESLYHPKVPVHVIPNGVDPTLFHPVNAQKQNVITYVGRFARIKGVHILLRAMKIVRAKYPSWKLWLVGDTFDQSMEYFTSIYNEGVIWTGYIPHENLLNIWKQSKICVVPTWGEGFEIALMEAVASGVPSITTGVAERREIYKDLVTFCALNNPADLAEKIIYVIENWEEQHKKALKASELARMKFSWDSIANDYLGILRHML